MYIPNGRTGEFSGEYRQEEIPTILVYQRSADMCQMDAMKEQVAQLWQRDREKLDTFSINVQRYSQNHAQNWIFGSPYGGISGNISTLSGSFNVKKVSSSVSSIECQF